MAGPLAILGVIGATLTACFLRDRNDLLKAIPEAGPAPFEEPKAPGLDRPSGREAFLELKDLFQRSYLVDYRKKNLAVWDPRSLAKFQARLAELREKAYGNPDAAAAFDIRPLRIFSAIANSSDPVERYVTYFNLFHDEFREEDFEALVSAHLEMALRNRVSLDSIRLPLGREIGEEISEPIIHRLAAQRIREKDPRLPLALISAMQKNTQAELEAVAPIVLEAGEEFTPSEMDIPISLSWLAASRGKLTIDYYRSTVERGQKLSLPVSATHREILKSRMTVDPFDDAKLFHRCKQDLDGEFSRLPSLDSDAIGRKEYFSKLMALEECLFDDPRLSTGELRLLRSEWSEKISNLQKNKPSEGLASTEEMLLATAMSWTEEVLAPGIQPPMKLSEFLRKYVTGLALGEGKTQLHEAGTVAPILQIIFLNEGLLQEIGSLQTISTIFHEAFHNHYHAEFAFRSREARQVRLLQERNAYLFEINCLKLFSRHLPETVTISEVKDLYWKQQLNVRASNLALGLEEDDHDLHESLPHALAPEIEKAYPTDLVPGYLERLGLEDAADYVRQGRPTLKRLKK